jgi:hypothetical protein
LTVATVISPHLLHTDEPARLLSRVGEDIYSTDFAENLLFQTLVNKAEILEVFRIVRFKSYPIFKSWMTSLQDFRATWSAKSKVIGQIAKALGNNVSGKLHARCETYSNLKLCYDKAEFQSYLERDSFVNFYPLTNEVCLMRLDGLSIPCRNLPTILARTYSGSKLFLWRHALTFQARLRHFGRFASSRWCHGGFHDRGERDGGRIPGGAGGRQGGHPLLAESVFSSLIMESTPTNG